MSSTNISSTTLTTSFTTSTSEFSYFACQKSFKKQSGFSRHIHHCSNRNVYKCVFREVAGYQALSKIFNNPLWDKKFYDEKQQTYIILFDNPSRHLKNNPLAITTAETKRRKSKYTVILEKLLLNGKLNLKKMQRRITVKQVLYICIFG
ncbi:hypothetical protein C1645_840266 [Glomus cerebriforme]|uniref:C2H2-type domain-containing protein n=1 Tax=Glomus cerebriforme TaxID=658196 RepID=A0A397RZM5_9GLOM|nr:hypothetical protein C1645_840266 [Glomus cerebriforme]